VFFESDPVVFQGRLTVLYRNLNLNSSPRHIQWLKQRVHEALRDRVPHFAAAVFVGEWPHWFIPTDKAGQVLSLRFWAWGEDEAQAMHNLGNIFENLRALFEALAAAIGLETL